MNEQDQDHETNKNSGAAVAQVEQIVMCMALATDSNKPCGCEAGYPMALQDGFSIPLCWHHAQMIKSGWYMAVGDEIAGQEKLRYFRTNQYGT